jgi:FixJ family two-component response regulator
MPPPAARIAIVDDDASVRRALARLLKAQSFDVKTFGSPTEFIDSLDGTVPDCLVVDLQMPEMNGLELQRYLIRARIIIPTVVITAHDKPEVRRQCEVAGAIAFLVKPLGSALLVAAIRRATRRDDTEVAPAV